MLASRFLHIPATPGARSGPTDAPDTRTPASSASGNLLRAAVAAVALGALAWPAAWAQDGNGAPSQWGLGLAVGTERAPYRDFHNKVRGLPLIHFENRWVSVLGPSLDIKLPSAGPVALALRAHYSGEGYKAEDSPYLAGMDERKASFWAGLAATWRTDVVNVSGEWLEDASGKSKGRKIRLQADRRFQHGAFDFTPRLAAHWADSKYVDYYYGVKSSEARPQRRAYQGDASVNMELGLSVGYALAPRQSIHVDISTTHFGSGIKKSPLVDRASTNGVRLGYLHLF
ncbi:MipA/OmpV family protein [Acidovorax sp.]|uniref:MipA/OmpV family protein n=1 Tax=Acidovorax sp. TaxID=1872122 RepID=UPI0025C7079B|nr:MipA/OmpV family protein [Acidovorax sp.]